jgi:uncharacterized protein YabN with tetrapyrrole methylase and pyrophosphatase domain
MSSEVFVVLSMDMGNVPLAVYDSFEAARTLADDIFTRSNKHACVAKFRLNVAGRSEVLDNVYDTSGVFEVLFVTLRNEFVEERKRRFVDYYQDVTRGTLEFEAWYSKRRPHAEATFRDIVKAYVATGETDDIADIYYENEYEMAGLKPTF